MKTLQQWFDEYALSHQDHTNKNIHYVCVPAIFFSIVGLLMSIPQELLAALPFYHPLINNWATVALIPLLLFYLRLSGALAFKMLLFASLCIVLNYAIAQVATLWIVSLVIFIIAWIGQFYGHKLEGKKPSFLKDLQFLLIGPAWVLHELFSSKHS